MSLTNHSRRTVLDSRKTVLCMLALALVAPAGQAGPYRVSVGTMPPVRTQDPSGYVGRVAGGGMSSFDPLMLGALAGATVSGFPLPGMLEPGQVHAPPPDANSIPRSQANLDNFLQKNGRPSAAFKAEVARVYSITDPAQIAALWVWYMQEPTSLAEGDRIGNAVVRYILATGQTTNQARPMGLLPLATTGTVLSTNGLMLCSSPFGPRVVVMPYGTQLRIVPPADGVWYYVESPQGAGWACGLWLDLH